MSRTVAKSKRFSISRQGVLAMVLLMSVLAVGYTLGAQPLVARFSGYLERSDLAKRKLAGYNRLIARRPAIEARMKALQEAQKHSANYLVEKTPNLAVTSLQTKVKSLVETSGGSVSSIQPLPAKNEGKLLKVSLRVQIQGDADVIRKVIHGIESTQPLLFLDDVSITATPRRTSRRNTKVEIGDIRLNGVVEGYMLAEAK